MFINDLVYSPVFKPCVSLSCVSGIDVDVVSCKSRPTLCNPVFGLFIKAWSFCFQAER